MDDYLRSGTVTPFLHTASAVSVALPLHLTPIRAAKKEGGKEEEERRAEILEKSAISVNKAKGSGGGCISQSGLVGRCAMANLSLHVGGGGREAALPSPSPNTSLASISSAQVLRSIQDEFWLQG